MPVSCVRGRAKNVHPMHLLSVKVSGLKNLKYLAKPPVLQPFLKCNVSVSIGTNFTSAA